MSSGEYLCIQDSDDIMLPERLRLQVRQIIRLVLYVTYSTWHIVCDIQYVIQLKVYLGDIPF